MTEAIQLNVNFLKSTHGGMKLTQIILGFVACILVGYICGGVKGYEICVGVSAIYGIDSYGGQGFVLAVLSVSIIINFLQFLLHLLSLNKVLTNINWRQTEMIYAMVMFILLLICCGLEFYYSIHLETYARWLAGAILILLLDVSFGAEASLIKSGRIEC